MRWNGMEGSKGFFSEQGLVLSRVQKCFERRVEPARSIESNDALSDPPPIDSD